SRVGRFEDYVMHDVLSFTFSNFPIRPEREAHVAAGLSMGGYGAFVHAINHRETFGTVVGVFPPLNLRWLDQQGRYLAPSAPNNWGWRTPITSPNQGIAQLYGGLLKIPPP